METLAKGIVGILVAFIVFVTGFVRVPEAAIELTAVARALEFQVADGGNELPPFVFNEITLGGSGKIEGIQDYSSYSSGLRIARAPNGHSLSLKQLQLPEGSHMRIVAVDTVSKTYQLTFTASQLTVIARDSFVVQANRESRDIASSRPRAIHIKPDGNAVVLQILLDEARWSTYTSFSIKKLSFDDFDETQKQRKRFSALEQGTIRFPSIQPLGGGGRVMDLYAGQFVEFGELNGWVRSLGFAQDKIDIGFSGSVSELRSVSGGDSRREMPSILAYFLSIDGVKEFGGAIIAIMVAFLAMRLPRHWIEPAKAEQTRRR